MATRYRLKRDNNLVVQRRFSVLNAAGNVLGGAATGVGKVMSSDLGQVAGGWIGAQTALGALNGAKLATAMGTGGKALGTAANVASTALGPLGTVGAAVVGYAAGKAITKGIGKGLKNAGSNLQT